MLHHALKLWVSLHPADVGAVIDRPRATISRPYKFYRYTSEFFDMSTSSPMDCDRKWPIDETVCAE